MRPNLLSLGLALTIIALAPVWVHAHAVGVTCTPRGKQVEVEVFFDDDTPAGQAKVQVVDAQGVIIMSGLTDAKGLWLLTAPPPGTYEVRVDAGAGHRTECSLTIPAEPSARETTIIPVNTRADFTRTPWLKILIGLIVIGGLSAAFLLSSLLKKTRAATTGASVNSEPGT